MIILAQGAALTGSPKILLVEDYTDIATIYTYMLESNGYEVKVAEDGNKALDLAKSYQPDIILLDIMIPGVDGIEVLKQLRTGPNFAGYHPHILIMSNLQQQEISDKAKEFGADGYVVKANMQNQEIVTIIQTLLKRSEAA